MPRGVHRTTQDPPRGDQPVRAVSQGIHLFHSDNPVITRDSCVFENYGIHYPVRGPERLCKASAAQQAQVVENPGAPMLPAGLGARIHEFYPPARSSRCPRGGMVPDALRHMRRPDG
jgi:hypothetical protein